MEAGCCDPVIEEEAKDNEDSFGQEHRVEKPVEQRFGWVQDRCQGKMVQVETVAVFTKEPQSVPLQRSGDGSAALSNLNWEIPPIQGRQLDMGRTSPLNRYALSAPALSDAGANVFSPILEIRGDSSYTSRKHLP